MFRCYVRKLGRLNRDERGSMVDKILIIALIILPIGIVLAKFRDELAQWFQDVWASLSGSKDIPGGGGGGGGF